MPTKAVTPELEAEISAVAAGAGCELAHVEYRSGTLRVFLDRTGGVRLEDCEAVSKQVSALLDVVDFGRGRYTLEVSSPGLDRQLYGPRDFERFQGRRVRVRYRNPDTGARATVVARLVAYRAAEGGGLELEVEPGKPPLAVSLADVELARLEIEL
ncbi:MAG: ribosome maturation factor RimP [Thermoanaerobaculia bacterium]